MRKLKLLSSLIMVLLLSTTVLANNGWQSVNYWVFTINGVPMKGWHSINGSWYYFDETYGFMMTNQWKETNGKWYYLGPDGKMLTNTYTSDGYWVDANGEWIQSYQNNQVQNNQVQVNTSNVIVAKESASNYSEKDINVAATSLGFDISSIKQTLNSLGLSPSTVASFAGSYISKTKYPLFHKHIINYMKNDWDSLEKHVRSLNQSELDALSKESMKVMTDTLGINSLDELSNKINSQGIESLLSNVFSNNSENFSLSGLLGSFLGDF